MSSLLDFIKTQDEAFRRLASLYSDFRYQRTSNPDGYAANSQAWLRALTAAAKAKELLGHTGGYVIPTGEKLSCALQSPQYGRPLALQAVIGDAVRQSQLIPVPDFINARKSIYDKSWVINPWQLVDWAWSQISSPVKSHGPGSLNRSGVVVVRNLEEVAALLETEIQRTSISNVSRIYSSDLFLVQFEHIVGSMTAQSIDFSVLIKYLSRDRRVLSYDASSGTIKFAPFNGEKSSPIAREDIDIASLRSLLFTLDKQVSRIVQEVAVFDSKVREAIASKNLTSAKRNLRLKKTVEATLEQRHATLDQLQGVYAKIEQAADQLEIVRVMQAAGRTLKVLNDQAGDVEDIREVIDRLQESMADTDDIHEAINNNPAAVIDDAEVEEELLALEQAETNRVAAQREQDTNHQQNEEAEQVRLKLESLAVPLDAGSKTVDRSVSARETAAEA